jgi:hypothetical protein
MEEALEFMEDYGFDVARATLLESSGRLSEAAELHLVEGRPVKAIQLFMRDWDMNHKLHSRQRAEACVLHGLWQHLTFASVVQDGYEKTELGDLLKVASDIKVKAGGKLSKHTEDKVKSVL